MLRVLRTGRLSVLEPKAVATGRHCSQSLPGTENSWMGDQPCLKRDVPCTLCAPACTVLARDLAPLNRDPGERKGQGLQQPLGKTLTICFVIPAQALQRAMAVVLLNKHGEAEQASELPILPLGCLKQVQHRVPRTAWHI